MGASSPKPCAHAPPKALPCFAEHCKDRVCHRCGWDGKRVCDKCDGKHLDADCPFFAKARESHRDARSWSHLCCASKPARAGQVLQNPRIVRQPGDGSCLFHSLAYGLGQKSQGSALRREIAMYIMRNPSLEVAETPLKEWIAWDCGLPAALYAARMAVGGTWGGAIEMAACARLKSVDIDVYELSSGMWQLIASFAGGPVTASSAVTGGPRKKVRVAYQGRMHYDAIVA
mmetsp:Transcript_10816/g.24481  ORF Transcript_10816/g.24481 Transcript_10816/m.24481 type:complete len:230 (-) Transcript_10816:124-813(-)